MIPLIQVIPEDLRTTASAAQGLGNEISGLADHAGRFSAGAGAAPPATAAGLEAMSRTMSRGIATLGDSVVGLGLATDVTARLYQDVDRRSMGGAG